MLSTLCLLIFLGNVVYAQDIFTDISGKKMSFFKELEKKNKGKVYQKDGDIIIPGGMAMPIMYRRVQKDMQDLIVNYVFTEKDSIMHTVDYLWDVRNYNDKDIEETPSAFIKDFVKKYQELLSLLTARYGVSTSIGNLDDFLYVDDMKKLNKSDRWSTKENTEVVLYTFRTHQYKPVFKIRLYVSPKRN